VLFLDEVHRFGKSQQDTFLPYLEDGTLTFIGATTENPSFEVGRCIVVTGARLRAEVRSGTPEIEQLLQRALVDRDRGLGARDLRCETKRVAVARRRSRW
jgi:putative ATPase